MNQKSFSEKNQLGWNQSTYQAWVNRHGMPQKYAQVLKANPEKKVSHYLKYMGDIKGKRIANLLGSKGNKAVSLALLGAELTVVDISEGNKRYATELAEAAGIHLHYLVCDVLDIPPQEKLQNFDIVLMEVGVLHYFVDLDPLFELISGMLKPGGKLILREYHPLVTKLMRLENNNLVANGNYFDEELQEVEAAFSKLLSDKERESLVKNIIRRWTLGEIVTKLVGTGLTIECLEEEAGIRWAFPENSPDGIENKIPGLFTILASK